MKIAILGTGNVGAALAERWREQGHDTVLGSREPDSARATETARSLGISVESYADAAAGAEVVVLAVPWGAVEATLAECGPLEETILIDCTNPLNASLDALELATTTSGGERVQELAPAARVVKAFNTTGAANLKNPAYGDDGLTMLIAGDDDGAKQAVAGLARETGFDPIDLGGIERSRLLEPLALIWITLAYKKGLGTDFGFGIVRR